jgi:hypothetical protein
MRRPTRLTNGHHRRGGVTPPLTRSARRPKPGAESGGDDRAQEGDFAGLGEGGGDGERARGSWAWLDAGGRGNRRATDPAGAGRGRRGSRGRLELDEGKVGDLQKAEKLGIMRRLTQAAWLSPGPPGRDQTSYRCHRSSTRKIRRLPAHRQPHTDIERW